MNRYQEQLGLGFGLVLRGIMLVLIVAWLTACGGGQGAPAVLIPGPISDGVPPGGAVGPVSVECPEAGGTAVDALAVCGGPDVICVGYFDGASIGTLEPLTTGQWPAWSPDGQQIAFHRDGEVYVINADGSGETTVGAGTHAAWSPDGRSLAFTGSEGIGLMGTDGSGPSTLVPHDFRTDTYELWDMGVSKPAWSPDGQRIAFEHLGDGDITPAQIFVTPIDRFQPALLSNTGHIRFAESDPAWSPDGGRIALWSSEFGIATVDAAGGTPQGTDGLADYGARPTWSAEGSQLAYTSSRCLSSLTIQLLDLESGALSAIVRNARMATWSPDGARIAVVTATALPDSLRSELPPVPDTAEIYVRESPHSRGSVSRYILYDDDRFELQILSIRWEIYSASGRYARDGVELTFDFDASSVAGPWQATGTLDGDRLTIRYNLIMMLSDFEDGVYVLSGG